MEFNALISMYLDIKWQNSNHKKKTNKRSKKKEKLQRLKKENKLYEEIREQLFLKDHEKITNQEGVRVFKGIGGKYLGPNIKEKEIVATRTEKRKTTKFPIFVDQKGNLYDIHYLPIKKDKAYFRDKAKKDNIEKEIEFEEDEFDKKYFKSGQDPWEIQSKNLRTYAPKNINKIPEFPDCDDYETYEQFEKAAKQWYEQMENNLGYLRLPTVLGSSYSQPIDRSYETEIPLATGEDLTEYQETEMDSITKQGTNSETSESDSEKENNEEKENNKQSDKSENSEISKIGIKKEGTSEISEKSEQSDKITETETTLTKVIDEKTEEKGILDPKQEYQLLKILDNPENFEPLPGYYPSFGEYLQAFERWLQICIQEIPQIPFHPSQFESQVGLKISQLSDFNKRGKGLSKDFYLHYFTWYQKVITLNLSEGLSNKEMIGSLITHEMSGKVKAINEWKTLDTTSKEKINKILKNYQKKIQTNRSNYANIILPILGKFHGVLRGFGAINKGANMLSSQSLMRRFKEHIFEEIRLDCPRTIGKNHCEFSVAEYDFREKVNWNKVKKDPNYVTNKRTYLKNQLFTNRLDKLNAWYKPRENTMNANTEFCKTIKTTLYNINNLNLELLIHIIKTFQYLDDFQNLLNEKQQKLSGQESKTTYLELFISIINIDNFEQLLNIYTYSNSEIIHSKLSYFIFQLIQHPIGCSILQQLFQKNDIKNIYWLAYAINYFNLFDHNIYTYREELFDLIKDIYDKDSIVLQFSETMYLSYYLNTILKTLKANTIKNLDNISNIIKKEIQKIYVKTVNFLSENQTLIQKDIFQGLNNRSWTLSSFFLFLFIQLLNVKGPVLLKILFSKEVDLIFRMRLLGNSRLSHVQNASKFIWKKMTSADYIHYFCKNYTGATQNILDDLFIDVNKSSDIYINKDDDDNQQFSSSGGFGSGGDNQNKFLIEKENLIPIPSHISVLIREFSDNFVVSTGKISKREKNSQAKRSKNNQSETNVQQLSTQQGEINIIGKNEIPKIEFENQFLLDILEIINSVRFDLFEFKTQMFNCIRILTKIRELYPLFTQSKVFFEQIRVCSLEKSDINYNRTVWKTIYQLIKYQAGFCDFLQKNELIPSLLDDMLAFSSKESEKNFAFIKPCSEKISYRVKASTECAGATIVLGLIRDIADYEAIKIEQVIEKVCTFLPFELQDLCEDYVKFFGTQIIDAFDRLDNPDSVALELGFCKDKHCRLYPLDNYHQELYEKNKKPQNEKEQEIVSKLTKSLWDLITEEINKITKEHVPILDLDKDHFATYKTLRGSNWRGRDCNDLISGFRPGIVPHDGDYAFDSNCNGIFGTDENGMNYEDKFCKDTNPMGVLVFGDSVGAHFRIPPDYLNAERILDGVLFRTGIRLLEMEVDFPHKSYGTGFDTSYDEICPGNVNSIYLEMRKRNRCNHRNYQNIAVNGMESYHISDLLRTSITKSQELANYPTITFLEIIGNDICAAREVKDFVTEKQFRANLIPFLDELDKTVAPGSKLIFVGMVRGSILFDTLHSHIHPIGHDIDYAKFYEYLKCQDVSPCPMWMTTNDTHRSEADKLGLRLDSVYKELAHSYSANNYEIGYLDFPLQDTIDYFIENDLPISDLIEPVDGFHPSQNGQALIAKFLWKNLNIKYPHFVPEENPYNDQIEEIFKDQGGY
ncbi:acyloxyacyl hydrolase [Anaeramoeba flamelloides]|uniref:Acyloxyacyl hydrolase n=1 Tax=Anaeramoeba flamelloides TaxID=1746091 RepID=A0AAV7Z7E3_9EUKA|nr:acyloxyacyl hydrolase [Anaeramoeba flamelloides]